MRPHLKSALLSAAAAAMLLSGGLAFSAAPKVETAPYVWATAPMGGGGFVDGFLYHPTEKGLLYARTDVGGAYRWDPANKSWIPITDGADSGDDLGVLSFAIDPKDPNKIYLATGLYTGQWARAGAVLRSNDRGVTWQKTDLTAKLGGNQSGRSTGERLQVDPNKGDILFLGTSNDGLLKSLDGAKTWSSTGAFAGKEVTFVLFDPRSGATGAATQTLYVGINDIKGPSLFVSHDGGGSWSPVAGAPKGLLPHHAAFDAGGAALYFTFANAVGPNDISDGGVYRYDPATGKWKDITPQHPGGGNPSFGYAGLGVGATPGVLIVSTLDRWNGGDTVFRSLDGGAHWVDVGANSKHHAEAYPWFAAYSHGKDAMGHWIGDIKINPFDPNEAVYGTGYGLWMSANLTDADHGKTVNWLFEDDNFEEVVPTDIVSPTAGAHLILTVWDIGGYRFSNFDGSPGEGGFFLPSDGKNNSVDVGELNPGYVVRVSEGAKNHAYYSRDNGATWAEMPSSPPIILHDAEGHWHSPGRIAVSAKGTSLVWSTDGGAYFSVDRGKTWAPSTGFPVAPGQGFFAFADHGVDGVFYVYNKIAGEVSMSIDAGKTFTVFARGLPPLEGWQWPGLARATPGHVRDIWIPTPKGLFHSPDDKSPFRSVYPIDEASGVGFGKPAEGQTYPAVYVSGKIGGVLGLYRSLDAGKTWVRINDDQHRFGGVGEIIGDPRVFGLVYVTTPGRGVVLGQPVEAAAAPK